MNIVGGGIAGLYAAILCRELEPLRPIHIFEQSGRLGGRVRTEPFAGQFVDLGAGRFGSRRRFPLTWTLVDHLNLRHRIIDLGPSSMKSIECGALRADPRETNVLTACTHGKALRETFGYDAEFTIPSAAMSLAYIRKYFFGNFYKLNGGLEQIVEAMVDLIQADPRTKIFTNTRISEVHQTYCRTTSGKMYKHDRVFVAVPPAALRRIRFPRSVQSSVRSILQAYAPVSLCRIFVVTDSPVPPQKGRWVSSGPVRMAFKMSDFMLQVYCDSYFADDWARQSSVELPVRIARALKDAFGLDVRIRKILRCYWKNGVHLWRIGYTPPDVTPRPWIAFVGEGVAEHAPGWIEGALESVVRVL